jgi:hypothetical protein
VAGGRELVVSEEMTPIAESPAGEDTLARELVERARGEGVEPRAPHQVRRAAARPDSRPRAAPEQAGSQSGRPSSRFRSPRTARSWPAPIRAAPPSTSPLACVRCRDSRPRAPAPHPTSPPKLHASCRSEKTAMTRACHTPARHDAAPGNAEQPQQNQSIARACARDSAGCGTAAHQVALPALSRSTRPEGGR